MPIDAQLFKQILGSFAAGVTVITTIGRDGKPYGLTATAFTSVSLDPPLVLVCVDKRAESHVHLLDSGRFAVAVLSTAQQDVSNRFAKSGGDKFADAELCYSPSGVPSPAGGLAELDCRTVQAVDAGDHTVFIAAVESGASRDGEPLLYFRGRYRALA